MIGITTYGRDEKNWFRLPSEYVDSVRRAGGLPVLLPPGESRWEQWLATIDGLILTGGGDIDPSLYGGQKKESNYMVDVERDSMEMEIARWLARSKIPGLCICRGMQAFNVALGGTLIEHLPDEVGEEVLHRSPPREPISHPVKVDRGSLVSSVCGATEMDTASWHHQAVRDLAPGLEVVGRASDGVVEAFEMASHPWLVAVQWHPELTAMHDSTQQNLFDVLVAEAGERRSETKRRS